MQHPSPRQVTPQIHRSSDDIYPRIVDETGQTVPADFDSIPKFYDDRKAAVTITLDDWADWTIQVSGWRPTIWILTVCIFLLHSSPTICPGVTVQEKINLVGDNMEIASHSRSHPCSPSEHSVNSYQSEVVGSRDAIKSNLTFSANPYIPLFVEPCSYTDETLQSWITAGDYLLSRSTSDLFPVGPNFVPWDATQGRYGRAAVTFDDSGMADDVNLLSQATKSPGATSLRGVIP